MEIGAGQVDRENPKFPVFFPRAGKISLVLDYGRLRPPPISPANPSLFFGNFPEAGLPKTASTAKNTRPQSGALCFCPGRGSNPRYQKGGSTSAEGAQHEPRSGKRAEGPVIPCSPPIYLTKTVSKDRFFATIKSLGTA